MSERDTPAGGSAAPPVPEEQEEGEAFPLLTADDFYDLLMEQQEQM